MEEEATPAIFHSLKEEESGSIKEVQEGSIKEMEEKDEIEDEAIHHRRLIKKYNLSKS